MSLPADQLDLLKTAANALNDWQDVAETVGVVLTQVEMEFPPDNQTNRVQFTWNPDVLDADGAIIKAGHFDIATLSNGR